MIWMKNPTPGDLVGCFLLKVEGEVPSCLWRVFGGDLPFRSPLMLVGCFFGLLFLKRLLSDEPSGCEFINLEAVDLRF